MHPSFLTDKIEQKLIVCLWENDPHGHDEVNCLSHIVRQLWPVRNESTQNDTVPQILPSVISYSDSTKCNLLGIICCQCILEMDTILISQFLCSYKKQIRVSGSIIPCAMVAFMVAGLLELHMRGWRLLFRKDSLPM